MGERKLMGACAECAHWYWFAGERLLFFANEEVYDQVTLREMEQDGSFGCIHWAQIEQSPKVEVA